MNLENVISKTINRAKKSLKSLAYAVVVGAVLAGGGEAKASIIYVNPGESIQSAINKTVAGDEVHVNPGTYYEKVTMKDGVDLIGAGADVTIIDAQRSEDYGIIHAKDIQDFTTTVSGFTLTNGGYNCEGIRLENSKMIIERNIIYNNGGCSGMCVVGDGIFGVNSSAIIRNNTICNNIDVGILICSSYHSNLEPTIIINNLIIGNPAGIFKDLSSTQPTLFNNDVWSIKENYRNVTPGLDDISEDPLFVGDDDFHLQLGSPCIDAGKDIGLPYYGSAPDMGAFEYIPEPSTLILLGGGLVGLMTIRKRKTK